jgi:hypothetical protein
MMKYLTNTPLLAQAWLIALLLLLALPIPSHAATVPSDVREAAMEADSIAGVDSSWDKKRTTIKLVENLRSIATVILLIALVVSAMSAGITGKTTMAIFVAAGAVVLYGGFWILLLIIENLGGTTPSSAEVTYEGPSSYKSPVSTIVKEFIGYAINMLTTATMPFLMIYGFWLSLGVASGESGGGPGPQIKNYVLGAIVAIGASIFTQIFFRW